MNKKTKSATDGGHSGDGCLMERLLGTPSVAGTDEEVARFRIRIGELAALNGEAWVRQHATQLLAQWEMALNLNPRGQDIG